VEQIDLTSFIRPDRISITERDPVAQGQVALALARRWRRITPGRADGAEDDVIHDVAALEEAVGDKADNVGGERRPVAASMLRPEALAACERRGT
jgi:hypothetical protein